MADQEDKFPPGPPHRPCGPWPSVFPYDRDYPGDHPHRPCQPVPGNVWWNDTEPVMGEYPWEHCCDGEEDPCLCITSGEVDIWNQTYSAVSGHSADWDRAVDDSWKSSADNWQSSYETVSANSGLWNSAYEIASVWNSGANESIYNIVSASSAFLSRYSAEPYIHVDSDYFKGNGSSEAPITLSDLYKIWSSRVNGAMNDLYSAGSWGESAHRNFLRNEDGEYYIEWIKYFDKLFWNFHTGKTDPDGNTHSDFEQAGGIFYQLEKLWNVINGKESRSDFEYAPDMTIENISEYAAKDTIYYNYTEH